MLAFAFLNPLLLWGLPLVAVPIVIHLLNRRRFKIVPWAAMEYLLAAMKRNRKRLRMEQWLVLLLRTLAVLLLVLLVTRPQLSGGGLIGVKTHHVVLLDDSASMQQRGGSTSLFEKAQDSVRTLADRLGETRSGDLFSLVLASKATQPELWGQRIGPELGRRIGQLLKETTVGDGPLNLATFLKVTRKRAAETKEAGRTEYYLVTDLRAYDWVTEDEKPRGALLAELSGLKPDTEHLTAVEIGSHETDNVGVVGVRLLDRLSIAQLPTTLAVDVQNFGLDSAAPTEIAVEIDGQSRVVRPVPQLAPGEKVSITITHTFGTDGFHRIEAALPPSDTYQLDDRRTLALEVEKQSRVLLVDGQPDEDNGETYFLSAALDPGGDQPSGKDVQIVAENQLGDVDFTPFDMVWLCNCPCPSEAVVHRLEQFVGAGGGLVVFAGSLVDAPRYNEQFYKGGKGLLPLAYGDVEGDPDKPEHMFLVRKDHPLAARIPEVLEVLLTKAVLVKRYLTMQEDTGQTAAILARVRDAEGSPVICSRPYGSGGGEVLEFGITADKAWTNMPDTYALVVIAQEAHRMAARIHDVSGYNLESTDTYRLTIDPGKFKSDVAVRSLLDDGEEHTFTAVDKSATDKTPAKTGDKAEKGTPKAGDKGGPGADQVPARLTLEVPMAELHGRGAYAVDLQGFGGEVEKRMFARSAPVDEGRLVRLTTSAFQRLYPQELHDRIAFQEAGSGLGNTTGQGEVWRLLAFALLAGLLLESLLAWRFGRR
jgi:Aerotolerance regulator N-terminal/CARDB